MVDFEAMREKWSKAWQQAGLGQADTDPDKPKFYIIWAYLTVSGFHHIGHMRGYSYTDAIARYKRLKGYNVLLCAGGHASGNSAVAKAQKVEKKDPETIEYYKEMGLSQQDLAQISTPEGFVDFFSKKYIQDYQEFGYLGDWRRFTVTTNSDYNKFIQWQFLKLKQKDLLVQKPYYGTACVIHGPVAVDPSESDISKGGNAEKNEYTLIKLQYQEPNQFIAAATLRPETMFGQTNIWVDYNVEYAKVQVGNEVWIVSKECADKLPFQKENVKTIGTISGKDMVGTYCRAPLADKDIIILPSEFCNPNIGTGIVTSVPSDAPADWMGLYDLQQSPELCAKYNLDHEVIKQIQPIPIIDSKDLGQLPGVELSKKLGIKNQHDHVKLEEAKKITYRKGFHTGVMLDNAGKYAGMKVEQAKEQVRTDLIESNLADIFFDLSEEVRCRCGEKVVIKKVEGQWFIKYSDEELTKNTIDHAQDMHIMPDQFKSNLPTILEWFGERACARQGTWLGTKLPFDPTYTVEPISDSTLYPIYYLVSRYVNEGTITTAQLTEKFFDYVYLGEGSAQSVSEDNKLDSNIIEQVRKDVMYWYPLDINVGGKEHQTVHFPVFLMNHVAVLPKQQWPKGIFVNWWVTAKGGKISKSKGGAKTIADEAKTYSVDAIRLYYANIASPFVDIAYEENDLVRYRSRLEKIHTLVNDIKNSTVDETKKIDLWLQSVFNKRLEAVDQAMAQHDFKSVTDDIYFNTFKDIQWYLRRGGANKELLNNILNAWFIPMSMFTPYLAEELHEVLGNTGFVSEKAMPAADTTKIDHRLEKIEDIIASTNSDILQVIKLAKVNKPKKITLIVSTNWKYDFFNQLHEELQRTKNIKELIPLFLERFPDNKQDVVKVLQKVAKNPVVPKRMTTQLDEFEGLMDAKVLLEKTHETQVVILKAEDSDHPKAQQASPEKPSIVVE